MILQTVVKPENSYWDILNDQWYQYIFC
uniref:Uncharacterized protein n=1 Tax=Anguilla anguilla TaxID=7936 RepID=A0A0E9XCY8_ANGAN